jgi:hypothetical protein
VRCGLGHAPGVAAGAGPAAFAGDGDQKVVTAVVATHPLKAVGKDAVCELFAENLSDIDLSGAERQNFTGWGIVEVFFLTKENSP